MSGHGGEEKIPAPSMNKTLVMQSLQWLSYPG